MERLNRREPLAQGLDKLVQMEIDTILATPNPPDDSTIHTIRVSAKKLRAYLRLLKKPLGKYAFDEANAIFRDMVRPLRVYRDTEILDGTLTSLTGLKGQKFTAEDADNLRESLLSQSPWSGRDDVLAKLHNDIHAERIALDLQALTVEWRDIADALKRSYRRNRNAFANAVRRPSGSNLHEWRKQSKMLVYQLKALGRTESKTITTLENNLDRLTGILGDVHDLAVLKAWLAEDAVQTHRAAWHAKAVIRRQNRKLRRKALKIGAGTYISPANELITELSQQSAGWRHKRGKTPLPQPTCLA